MRQRHAGSSMVLGLGLVLAAMSCDGERDVSEINPLEAAAGAGSAGGCVPGQIRACEGVCGPGSDGYQVCASDGASYGDCVCPPSSTIGSDRFDIDRRAAGGIRLLPIASLDDDLPLNTPGNPLQGSATIGASCGRDDDCAGGLICFDIGDGLAIGGPAGGYCTRPCNSAAQCEQVDRASACGALAGQNLCIRLCEAGEVDPGDVKCLGREDLTCLSLNALGDTPPADRPELGICAPRCQSDAACDGLRCDPRSGFCTIFPGSESLPIGATCTAGAQCEGGVCFAPSNQAERFCSAFCTLGAPGCGFDGSDTKPGAGCVLPQIQGESSGDQGLCVELCDSAGDCLEEGSVCAEGPHDGRSGVCVKQAGSGDPPPPPPAPSDAQNLGKRCEVDADCAGNLLCLTAASDPFGAGGGPAGGYCSMPCQGNTDCPVTGLCARTPADDGLCLRTCVIDGPGECGGRADVACIDIGAPACLPACNSDEGCGDRRCDIAGGLCVDAPEPECAADADCAPGTICDTANGECVPAPDPGCSVDTDCASGEICDTETAECVAAPPSSCTTDADCVAPQRCDLDTAACITPPPPPCVADTDCAATEVCNTATGQCILAPPTSCTTDADCPGRVCNPSSLVCIDAPAIPIGGACSDDAECAGEFCASIRSSLFCSGFCLLGSPIGCEPYGSEAFCLIPVQDEIGACLELCNTGADCAQPGYVCTALTNPINAHTGACLPPPLPAPPATP
jgi:hypothetical protein